ncbi:hemagglutinin domain-containing protein [Campylobacter peloridis LMG 23910]|uniref:two-partner secretion domain-containing protein n=1 Tax=Campylobacter peloridis TaxID=488546 RepID=UPI000581D876|nr:filamentous hemagglutinin N-terminal domain-containing protein [Campylobacter peloridis]AJC85368.1 hemagglutinin domain-containing protein [Campylobacter peloridis LMG 23910]
MAVFSPRGGGSNNFDLTPSKKLTNHILLSSIVASLLFSPAFALPSGGKFTHGTSGTINVSGNNMHIHGNKVNSVIQWGGGFNINKGESVNFGGNSKNYLNIAHGTNKSTIAGILNASGNNVFLINPNGVIITKTGNINANRFVASTSSMSNDDMNKFANMKTFEQGASFSPVFKPNPKGGNVINMGNINANDVLLIGNKVLIQGYLNTKDKTFNQIKAIDEGKKANIHLVGNEIYADIATFKDIGKLYITAKDKGSLYLNATGYYYNPSSFKDFDFIVKNYNGINHNNTNFSNMKYVGIGSDVDWWHFAKGWNEYNNDFRTIANEYRLINDIDFQANCKNGVCTGQNYANYWVDLNGDGIKQDNEFTSMIINGNYFTKTFDGQGYTLKNINIDTTKLKYNPSHVGIFGAITSTIKNVNVDYMGGGIKAKSVGYLGGFVGLSYAGALLNISLSNMGYFSFTGGSFIGGFAGSLQDGIHSNISLNNIGDISVNNVTFMGGFAGYLQDGIYSNISLNNIGDISVNNVDSTGGFAGYAGIVKICNISLEKIGNINRIAYNGYEENSHVGAFIARVSKVDFSNIYLKNIGNIFNEAKKNDFLHATAGGFIGYLMEGDTKFENIFIFFNPNIKIINETGLSGKFFGALNDKATYTFNNIHIYHHEKDLANATADKNYWGSTNDKIQIHTYADKTQESVYKDFLSKANTIEKPTIPNKPSDNDVILASDDLYKDIVDKIITDLYNSNTDKKIYNLYLVNLLDMLKDKANYSNMSENQKVEFVAKYFLSGDKTKALEVVQSLDFLLAYEKNGLSTASKDKFDAEALNLKNTLLANTNKVIKNKNDLSNFLENDLKNLLINSNQALASLKLSQEQLKIAITKYNDYVKKINENPSIKNEATLASLKAEVDRLSNLSGELATTIANNQIKLETWQKQASDKSNQQFNIIGKFDNIALTIPNLEKLNNSSGIENDDYQKLSRQIASSQKQTPTFKYEEEETQEIDEAALTQRARTCIVSDNFKTMNPCVVESY